MHILDGVIILFYGRTAKGRTQEQLEKCDAQHLGANLGNPRITCMDCLNVTLLMAEEPTRNNAEAILDIVGRGS
ncbi:hypothetical protein ColLi_02504 [Colletotrichum liriopes]|uniref:Uncharacterized protein n=1 Tax=Colletotrichum liriopes TaxID=708192 RepID=A0AA37GEX0_9PEZI|nr:hypothetical protein ColLi_02504 [Colletotrichum liriopes]